MLSTSPTPTSFKAMAAAAEDQQERNYPCGKQARHGPLYQPQTFPIRAATSQKVSVCVQKLFAQRVGRLLQQVRQAMACSLPSTVNVSVPKFTIKWIQC